jgi:hypothetical protein
MYEILRVDNGICDILFQAMILGEMISSNEYLPR